MPKNDYATTTEVASTYLIRLCVGRILYAAGLPAFVAVIGVMVVLSVSITLGGSGTVASRAGRRFIGGGRTFHAFHQLAVATVFDDRRKLRSWQRNKELATSTRLPKE